MGNVHVIRLEPSFERLNGVVDRRVDHGQVESRRTPGRDAAPAARIDCTV